jgi:hypothetical protein
MTCEEVLGLLRQRQDDLNRFGVKSLALFGSCARGEMHKDSDIDILVEFDRSIGLFEFIRLKNFLEDLLKRPVDLTTPDALKRQLRERILSEAVYAG